jgi:protein-disulfide isomerase
MVRFMSQILAVTLAAGFTLNLANAANEGTRSIPKSSVDALLAPPLASPASGNQDAKVTVVEFFDYQCPICRGIAPDLKRLVLSDHNVRIVHKDLPVFGEVSKYAAYCSYAAARMGKYQAAHDALIGSHVRLESKEAVHKVLTDAGFEMKALDADIAQHEREYASVIARNEHEAMLVGVHGTPGVIVGNRLVQGSIDYDRLEQLAKR